VSQLYNKINETIINELSQQGVVDSLMKGIDLSLTFNDDRKDILQTTSTSHKINDNIIKHIHSKDKATTSYFQNSTISHLMFPLKDTNIIVAPKFTKMVTSMGVAILVSAMMPKKYNKKKAIKWVNKYNKCFRPYN
jgi:hypothetical protein